MQKIVSSLAALAAAFTVAAWAAPALAQGAVWVSASGSNSNDCLTPANACRFFDGATGALAKISEGGTIHVLPGDYDTVEITKSVHIVADAGQAGVVGISQGIDGVTATFVVNAASSDFVRIRGLIVNPSGTGSSIALIRAQALHVENCTLVGSGTDPALHFAPANASELYVSNCKISENASGSAGGGILIRPTGSGSAKAVIDNVSMENNATGVVVDGRATTGSLKATVRDSSIAGSTSFGLFAVDSGGGATEVTVEESNFGDNGTFGVGANGANVTVRVRNSVVTGNANGLVAAAGSSLVSLGGNNVIGNTTNGAFTQTLPQQ